MSGNESLKAAGATGRHDAPTFPPGLLFSVGRHGEGTTTAERVAWVKEQYDDPAVHLAIDRCRHDERAEMDPPAWLIRSVALIGVQEPPIVAKLPPDRAGVIRVLIGDGRQRIEAAVRAAPIRADEQIGPPLDVTTRMIRFDSPILGKVKIACNARVPLSPLQQARDAAEILNAGGSDADAMALCGISSAQGLKNLLALLDAPPVVQHAVERGKVSQVAAREIAKTSPTPAEAQRRVEVIAGGGDTDNASAGTDSGHGTRPPLRGPRAQAVARGGEASAPVPRMARRDVVERLSTALGGSKEPGAAVARALCGWFTGQAGALDQQLWLKSLATDATKPGPREQRAAA